MQTGSSPRPLTELEGAILTEISHRGDQTAFKVRRSFAVSPSLEWRGSAGAVYPAIRRLEEAGLIEGESTGDRRQGRLLSLTAAGDAALLAWARDLDLTISVGIDPFRLRAGIWLSWDGRHLGEHLSQLEAALATSITVLESYSRHDDLIERAGIGLAIVTQKARLEWVRVQKLARQPSAGSI